MPTKGWMKEAADTLGRKPATEAAQPGPKPAPVSSAFSTGRGPGTDFVCSFREAGSSHKAGQPVNGRVQAGAGWGEDAAQIEPVLTSLDMWWRAAEIQPLIAQRKVLWSDGLGGPILRTT